MALSEGARKWSDSMVGIWEFDFDRYVVWHTSPEGELSARSLTTGEAVGAGLPISGSKVGLLPDDFHPSLPPRER